MCRPQAILSRQSCILVHATVLHAMLALAMFLLHPNPRHATLTHKNRSSSGASTELASALHALHTLDGRRGLVTWKRPTSCSGFGLRTTDFGSPQVEVQLAQLHQHLFVPTRASVHRPHASHWLQNVVEVAVTPANDRLQQLAV